MRDFIGSILLLMGMLALIGTVVSVMFPAKFALKWRPEPTRASNFFAGFFITVVLLAVGGLTLPAQPGSATKLPGAYEPLAISSPESKKTTVAKNKDSELVQIVFSEIRAIENLASKQQDAFLEEVARLATSKSMTTSQKASLLRESFDDLIHTLEKSNSIAVPDLEHAEAKRHLTDAIDLHKKWAVAQQAKLRFFSKGEFESAKELNQQAQQLAMQEAIALAVVFKEVGAKLP